MKTLQKTTKNLVCFFPNPLKIDNGTPKSVRRSNFHVQERFFRSQERFWPSRGVPRRAIFFRQWKTFENGGSFFKLFRTFLNLVAQKRHRGPSYKLALCNVQHPGCFPYFFHFF